MDLCLLDLLRGCVAIKEKGGRGGGGVDKYIKEAPVPACNRGGD